MNSAIRDRHELRVIGISSREQRHARRPHALGAFATTSTPIIFMMKAFLAPGLRGGAASNTPEPRSHSAKIRLNCTVWREAKARWTSLAEPKVERAKRAASGGAARLRYWAPPKNILPLNLPLDPSCWGSVSLRGVPTAEGYARRRGRVIRDVKRGLWPLPSRSRAFSLSCLDRPLGRSGRVWGRAYSESASFSGVTTYSGSTN
jgi:hypothetical protein